jgi:glycine cleavage system H protein
LQKARSEVPEIGERQVTVGKFIFRVREGYLYTEGGVWVSWDEETGLARVGLSDFRQQSSGDVAFVELQPAGQKVQTGDDLANVETVKVDLTVPAPFDATVVATNDALTNAPELINQDPYGTGWLVELAADAGSASGLMGAQAYLEVMTAQAEEASK